MFADGRFTDGSIQDYLVLLSLYQSCEYQGINFLQYLRNERVDGRVAFGTGMRKSARKDAAESPSSGAAEASRAPCKAADAVGQAAPSGIAVSGCLATGSGNEQTNR